VSFFLATGPLGLFDASVVYDHFGELLVTSSLFALILCAVLYCQGLRMPASSDAGGTGRPIWDFYWGTQLHPRLFEYDLKQLINCRYAMMGWSIIVVSAAAAQVDRHGHLSHAMLACAALQMVYLFKFFVWEGGYFHSLDITHDRFGFYIAWGVCGWLPIVYTLPNLYLVDHPGTMSRLVALALFLLGLTAIIVNYQADRQRQRFRATNGNTKIWGRKPKAIVATYTTADGVTRKNLLLVSGWWGVARHFHYLPELTVALAWTLPVGFHHFVPWFYVLFLATLLVHRSLRDDDRCARKYGEAWKEYKRRVRWRILPGVF
jgi:7-dehydrocholesterol reductase